MSTVKFHFEDNLDFQSEAIAAAAGLFKGQEQCRSEFTVIAPRKELLELDLGAHLNRNATLGVGNRLELLPEEILENLVEIQFRNGLPPAEKLENMNFTIEMETGTGKTYVYLRTVFELNRQYGFTKFIIVVPSVAIKEGVYTTLRQTKEHFLSLYPGAAGYHYFLYDSANIEEVRSFATSDTIEIMVITVGAINKADVNNIYEAQEKTSGEKPIDLIRATRPVLIVDEPQSVDGGIAGKGKSALDAMDPLCTLRYSATHVDKYHQIYRLDSIAAYEKQLVKQIEVAALEIEGDHNKAYIKCLAVDKGKRGAEPSAKLEIDIQRKTGVVREIVSVSGGDNLEQTSGRELYRDCSIREINAKKGYITVAIPNGELMLSPGDGINGLNGDDIARLMIGRTIKEHLDKELRLTSRGIKVLSLFFVPSVDKYRIYDKDGNRQKGTYAKIFEEEYAKFSRDPKYTTLFRDVDIDTAACDVHDGYFSIDKTGKLVETAENDGKSRENAERAYELIMKKKEELLSFDTKLKFIFSHSALKEGWDNPNVFQICNLRDMRSERERRQTIGRGLRLCVDQHGERIRGFDTNTLTVIANESYERFAEELQKEIELETGIRFGVVEREQFAAIAVYDETTGKPSALGVEASKEVYEYLEKQSFIDKKGKVTEELKKALSEGTFTLPETLAAKKVEDNIKQVLGHLASRLKIRDANKKEKIRLNKERFLDPQFKELWDRIKYKTTYRVDFDNDKLVEKCTEAVRDCPAVAKARARFLDATISIDNAGVGAAVRTNSGYSTIYQTDVPVPDILTDLETKTKLTRKSLCTILTSCKRLEDFKQNPQQFIEFAGEAINRKKREMLVDGISYKRIGDTEYYAQELFDMPELEGYLANMLKVEKSVYEYVVYDSEGIEKPFAQELEQNEKVKVYAKLPDWFKIPTPLGTYNPDWAIVVDENGRDKLYLVVETKGSLWWDDLRHIETGKIGCAYKHFDAVAVKENPAKYKKAKRVGDVV